MAAMEHWVWGSAEEGRTFYASDTYKCIFGSVVHLVSDPPFHKQFDVRIETVPEASPA